MMCIASRKEHTIAKQTRKLVCNNPQQLAFEHVKQHHLSDPECDVPQTACRLQEMSPVAAGRSVLPQQAGVRRPVHVLQGVHTGVLLSALYHVELVSRRLADAMFNVISSASQSSAVLGVLTGKPAAAADRGEDALPRAAADQGREAVQVRTVWTVYLCELANEYQLDHAWLHAEGSR